MASLWWSPGRAEESLLGDGPAARTPALAKLEAVLFLAREPLGSRKVAQLAGLADGTEARTLVRKLNRLFDLEGCAFCAVEVAGGFQLMTRPKFAPWLRRLSGSPVEVRLSAPAMETLAVVAYRQPVLRAEVEAVRGVQCGEILRQLMERELVRIAGRSEELGRPFLYGTTRRFLEVFGLRHLEELPRAELARAAGPDGAGEAGEATEPRGVDDEAFSGSESTSQFAEEQDVKVLAGVQPGTEEAAEQGAIATLEQEAGEPRDRAEVDDRSPDEDDDEYEDGDDEDYEDEGDDWEDDDFDDEEEEDEEDEDEDLEDEPWEEVEDDENEEDEDEEEDDWDEEEDEDWDEDEEEGDDDKDDDDEDEEDEDEEDDDDEWDDDDEDDWDDDDEDEDDDWD